MKSFFTLLYKKKILKSLMNCAQKNEKLKNSMVVAKFFSFFNEKLKN